MLSVATDGSRQFRHDLAQANDGRENVCDASAPSGSSLRPTRKHMAATLQPQQQPLSATHRCSQVEEYCTPEGSSLHPNVLDVAHIKRMLDSVPPLEADAEVDWKQWSLCVPVENPIQTDSYSCGRRVCHAAKVVSTGMPSPFSDAVMRN